MWRCKLTERNCVSTYILLKPLLMQFDSGMSIRRYLPASGTAGLLRYLVSGYRRVPRPPPSTREMTFCILNSQWRFAGRRHVVAGSEAAAKWESPTYAPPPSLASRAPQEEGRE